MSEKWNLVPLGECAEIIMGQSPKGDSYNTQGVGIPLINGPADYGIIHPKPKQWTTRTTKLCIPGDIIFCVRASVGKMNLANESCCIGRGVAAIRGKKNLSLTPYLMEILAFHEDEFVRISKGAGTTFPNLTSKELAKHPIPLPPLPEQKRIASSLSAVDNAINHANIAITESKRMKNGLIQIIQYSTNPDWKECLLGDVVDINPEQRSPTTENCNESIMYVDIDAIENGSGCIVNPKSYIFKDAPSRARRVIRKDDVIVSMVRPENLGFAYVPKKLDNQICSTGFAVLRGKGKTNPHFLLNLMFSENVLNQFRKFTVGGQYPSLTQKTIAKTKIKLPKISEQNNISNILQQMDVQIVLRKKRKFLLENLKRGMIQQLLSGVDAS